MKSQKYHTFKILTFLAVAQSVSFRRLSYIKFSYFTNFAGRYAMKNNQFNEVPEVW
jgi:hypothetical protein